MPLRSDEGDGLRGAFTILPCGAELDVDVERPLRRREVRVHAQEPHDAKVRVSPGQRGAAGDGDDEEACLAHGQALHGELRDRDHRLFTERRESLWAPLKNLMKLDSGGPDEGRLNGHRSFDPLGDARRSERELNARFVGAAAREELYRDGGGALRDHERDGPAFAFSPVDLADDPISHGQDRRCPRGGEAFVQRKTNALHAFLDISSTKGHERSKEHALLPAPTCDPDQRERARWVTRRTKELHAERGLKKRSCREREPYLRHALTIAEPLR